MKAATKRRGLLRPFLAPAPPALTRERFRAAVDFTTARKHRLLASVGVAPPTADRGRRTLRVGVSVRSRLAITRISSGADFPPFLE